MKRFFEFSKSNVRPWLHLGHVQPVPASFLVIIALSEWNSQPIQVNVITFYSKIISLKRFFEFSKSNVRPWLHLGHVQPVPASFLVIIALSEWNSHRASEIKKGVHWPSASSGPRFHWHDKKPNWNCSSPLHFSCPYSPDPHETLGLSRNLNWVQGIRVRPCIFLQLIRFIPGINLFVKPMII